MSLKYERLKIQHPKNKPVGNNPGYVEMRAVEAKEFPVTVPAKEAPILWRLLTTHIIDSTEDALKCAEWLYITRPTWLHHYKRRS